MSEKTTVLASEIKKAKEGQSKKGPWVFYLFIDGNETAYGWLDGKAPDLYNKAKPLMGKRVEIEYEINGDRKTLIDIKEAASENGDQPKLGTGEYIKGQAAPSDARRMLIRGAHDNATLAALETLKFQTAREITPDLVKATLSSFIDFFWTDALRKAELMEDKDIPFMPEYEGQ